MQLSRSIEAIGFFWDPAKPESQIPGTLKIDKRGLTRVALMGHIGSPIETFNGKQPPRELHGALENGSYVSLVDNFYSQSNLSLTTGINTAQLQSAFALVYAPIEPRPDGRFHKVRFSVQGLDEWLGITGIDIEHTFIPFKTTIRYSCPERILVPLNDGVQLWFGFDSTHPSGEVTEATITQKAYAYLEWKEARPLEDILSVIRKLANFFTIAVGRTVSLTSVSGFVDAKVRNPEDDRARETPVDIYYESTFTGDNEKNIEAHRMLFRYQQVSQALTHFLRNWLDTYGKYEPALNLYFAARSGSHRYQEGRFLSLIQALETLHRRASNETKMAPAEFKNLVEVIVEAAPEAKREWLANRLRYANELSLHQRLKLLLEPFARFFPRAGRLASWVSDTRNYHTHYDPALAEKAATAGKDLCLLSEKLEALTQLHLLKAIGLPDDHIDAIVGSSQSLKASVGLDV